MDLRTKVYAVADVLFIDRGSFDRFDSPKICASHRRQPGYRVRLRILIDPNGSAEHCWPGSS